MMKIRFWFVLLMYFFSSAVAIALLPSAGWAVSEADIIIKELRRDLYEKETEFEGQRLYMGGFGITIEEANDSQLKQFFKNKNNQKWIQVILLQNWFGQGLQLWAKYEKDCLTQKDIEAGREVIKYLSNKAVFGIWKHIAGTYELYFLNATLTATSTMLTLLGGAGAVFNFISVVDCSYWGRELFREYIQLRKSKEAEDTFEELSQNPVFSTAIDYILNVRYLKKLSHQEKRRLGVQYLEYRYQSWNLATNPTRREAIKRYILDNIPRPNRPPIANAGDDQTELVNNTVRLNGSASYDPDGDQIKGYEWTILPRENSARCKFKSSRTIVNPEIVPLREGSCTIQLIVNDGKLNSAPDQVVITARRDIAPPTLINNFQASDNEDSQSTLTWTNPSDSDLAEVIVRRKTSSYPTSHNDGDLVYQNTNPTPGDAITHTDTGLTNGTIYYYAAFSRDKAGNWNDQVVEGKNADTGRPQVPPPPPSATAPWTMFQNNAQHTGQSANSGPASGNVSWTYNLGSIGSCWGASLQPVVDAQGIVYFGVGEHSGACDNRGLWGKVYAFNQDGSIKWQSSNLGTPPYGLAIGSDGTIYVSTVDKGIIALNSDGTEKWRFYEEGMSAVFSITIGKDGTLYFTDQQRLYSVNADGSKQWTACCWPYGSASGGPAVAADGTIYVVWTGFISGTDGRDGFLSAYAPDGTFKWRSGWLDPYASAPVIGPDNTIYVVTGVGSPTYRSLYAFNSNGDMLWRDSYRYGEFFVPVASPAGAVIITETQGGVEPGQGACFVSYLRALNSTGDIIWTWGPEENLQITVQPILDVDSNIFIGGTIYERRGAWCVPIGSRLYRIKFQGTVDWSFSVSGSRAISSFALGANRHLYATLWALWESSELPDNMMIFYALGESIIQNTTTQNSVVSERTGLGSVQFSVPGAAALRIELFNLAGRKIYDSNFVVGSRFRWDGFTNDGQRVANGVYLYVVTIRKQDGTILRSQVKKLVILR